jgi:hypothetical protein
MSIEVLSVSIEAGASTTPAAARERTTAEYARGALFGLGAVLIWAGNVVVGGLGLRSSLTPWDITAIRFAVAGLVLLPYVMRRGFAIDRLGWIGLAALVLGGAPTVLLANAGLLFAPASHAGALYPGVMPLMVALLAAPLLRERFTRQKRIGFLLISVGIVGIVWVSGATIGTLQNVGHFLFVAAAAAFACFTVAMRRARLDGLHAAAISAVGSMVIYLPPYAVGAGAGFVRCAGERHRTSSGRTGSPDGGLLVCHLRARGQHCGRFQRSGVRGLMPGDDGRDGDSDPGRVAVVRRLDGNRAHLGRCLCRQRRTNAAVAGAINSLLFRTWTG